MSKVRIEVHAPDNESAQFRALATVKRPGAPQDDQFGGYGSTPLAAAIDLAKTLANVVGYERHEFERMESAG